MITEATFTEFLMDYEEYLHQKGPPSNLAQTSRSRGNGICRPEVFLGVSNKVCTWTPTMMMMMIACV